jgi:V/A-type H+-transporting ATPase subunit I
MAIERVKKAYILIHAYEWEEALKSLQRAGLLHIEKKAVEGEVSSKKIDEIKLKIAQADFIHKFLSSHAPKRGFIKGLFREKAYADIKEIEEAAMIPFSELYSKCEEIESELSQLNERKRRIEEEIEDLKPWLKLKLPFKKIEAGKNVHLSFFKISISQESYVKEFFSSEELSSLKEINRDEKFIYFLVAFHRSLEDKFSDFVAESGAHVFDFSKYEGTPQEEIDKLKKEKEEIIAKVEKLESEAKKLLRYQRDILILKAYLEVELRKAEVEAFSSSTKKSFLIEGWVRERDVSALKKALSKATQYYELSLKDPLPEENPPIILRNPSWLKPFEILTELYGLPHYREIDPTPIMAPFFLLFFGMCLGDVGYGLLLSLVSFVLSRKLPLSRKGRDFMKLFIYGGVSSAVVGFFTGSYFALPSGVLPTFLKSFVILDPVNNPRDPVKLFVISLIIGFSQLLTGLFVEMFDKFRHGKYLDSLLDEGSIVTFLLGAGGLIVVFLQTVGGGAAPSWTSLAWALFLIGSFMIVFFSNRTGNIIRRFFSGLYSLYGMTSYLGDTISYARLMALGIATVLIGWSINLICDFILKWPVVGIVVAAVVFVVGHIANLVINLLGAFVHPLRLQFVEFFKQFFEGGGESFKPFSFESQYIILD